MRRFQLPGHPVRSLLVLGLVLALCGTLGSVASAAPDSQGTDFWLVFTHNYTGTVAKTLFITGSVNTTGTVEIPGLAFSTGFSVTAGTVTSVSLPDNCEIRTSNLVEEKGIHVTANDEVTVYGLSRQQYTTDAFLGLPTDVLGTDYVAMCYYNSIVTLGTEFGMVATEDNTTVTITPTETTDGHTAGVPYVVILDQGDAYQLTNGSALGLDLTGSTIESDKPIAVFTGHQCANIPPNYAACDYIVEEIPPTSTWGKSFLTEPLATRTGGDTFRMLASEDTTTVQVNGSTVATLDRGEFHEMILPAASTINADKPILVAQFSNGQDYDNTTADPFMMLVPPYEQFQTGYTVTTPASGFAQNFVNVVAPAAAVGNITLDGVPIPGGLFAAIGASGFSGAQVPVALGSHAFDGPLPFGVFVYGFADYDSYGYIGGLALGEVAEVTTVSLAPKTAVNPVGAEHCVTATVLDQSDNPLAGIRVDFAVTGFNPTNGSAVTDTLGEAQFCYTGTVAGTDTITASVGDLSDTGTKTWIPAVTVCPLSQGYWKTHPGAWPVDHLTLGTLDYEESALLGLLASPVRGDASLTLAKQLIAAKLNVLNGADPTPVASEIADADALIGNHIIPLGVKTSTALGHQMTALASTLDMFNNGQLTPGCVQQTEPERPAPPTGLVMMTEGTKVSYQLPETRSVTLSVYDVTGRKLAVLVNDVMGAGSHTVTWDGRTLNGTRAPQGLYFYRIQAGSAVATQKVLLLR